MSEQRICEIIAAYYCATEEGHAPQLRELMEQHPDLADDLKRYFLDEERIRRVTQPLQCSEAAKRESQATLSGFPVENEIEGAAGDRAPACAWNRWAPENT